MKIKIVVYKLSKTLFLTSNNIPMIKLKQAFMRSLGLLNSIQVSGINKKITPMNKYKKSTIHLYCLTSVMPDQFYPHQKQYNNNDLPHF